MFDGEQYDEPIDTCSEMNYNVNYHNDCYYDTYSQNGDYGYDSYSGYASNKKSLPQPPMSLSQSVNDGFGHRFEIFLNSKFFPFF